MSGVSVSRMSRASKTQGTTFPISPHSSTVHFMRPSVMPLKASQHMAQCYTLSRALMTKQPNISKQWEYISATSALY